MRDASFWKVTYSILTVSQWVNGATIVVVSACLNTETVKLATWFGKGLADLVTKTQDAAGWLLPILTILFGLAQLPRKIIGPPWRWKQIHGLLDFIRDNVYDKGDDVHANRVTLFKHRRWCLRLRPILYAFHGGWLVPVARSGHASQRTKALFRAPDDTDKAEGWAGKTWARWKVQIVNNLPDVSANMNGQNVEVYATVTGVTTKWILKRRPKTRSLAGIPVLVQGKAWGVIVLDSKMENAISERKKRQYEMMGGVLSHLLVRL